MSNRYFRSWKGYFTIAAAVTIVIAVSVSFEPKSPETIAIQQAIEANFPGGKPSETIRARVLKEPVYMSVVPSTLGELERYIIATGAEVRWELIGPRVMILRARRYDQLADKTYDMGIQFEILDEKGHVNLRGEPSPGVVLLTGIIAGTETRSAAAIGAYVYQMDGKIRIALAKGQI